jgi:hypothetical protein
LIRSLLIKHRKSPKDFRFFNKPRREIAKTSLVQGLESTRDTETEDLIRKHADLSARKQFAKLSAAQTKEFRHISNLLKRRLTAPGETLADSHAYEEKDRLVQETLRHLKNGQ